MVKSSFGRPIRMVLVQFGDHGVGEKRLAADGLEDYYAQRYTVNHIAGLVGRGVEVVAIFVGKDVPLERLPSGVANMGINLYPDDRRPRIRELIQLIAAWKPSHLLLGIPLPEAIWWAVKNDVKVLPMLADSFAAADPKSRLRHFLLAVALNHPAVPFVVNHGINAARDLVRIGVPAQKVLAFDWPAVIRPEDFPTKSAPLEPEAIRIFFVGQISELKGLGDSIRALSLLGPRCRLTVAGKGDQSTFLALAREMGVADRVVFTGPIPHREVLRHMHEHDVVVVPSRHDYPEGLPMTIYEGLCSRTPVVVSDHPMFREKIVEGRSGMMFRAADHESMAAAIRRLVTNSSLYEGLSAGASAVCRTFFSAPQWHEVIDHWLSGSSDDVAWFKSRTVGMLPPPR